MVPPSAPSHAIMPPSTPKPLPTAKPAKPSTALAAPTNGATPTTPAAPRYTLDASGPGGLDKLLAAEWLLTNGLGGFAMGTCAGVPARRYHALLIAAAKPPVDRIAALNAMVESVVIGTGDTAKPIDLSTFRFCGHPPLLHPQGISRLKRFEQDTTCRWTYEIREGGGGAALEVVKEITLIRAQNAAQIRYRVKRLDSDKAQPIRLRIRPLTSLRDFHALIRRGWADRFTVLGSPDGARVLFADHPTQLHLRAERAKFTTDTQWWENFFYDFDALRGQDSAEDLFSPGEFSLNLNASEPHADCIIQASIAPMAMITQTQRGATGILMPVTSARTPSDQQAIAALATAADAFVVAKTSPGTGQLDQASIIAGYPWFADWGRDSSISLPGLMLATGRLDEARRTLLAFASHRRNGIVPNVFNDRTGEPEYNTVDASLWFILGACAFRKAGGERAAWDGHLAPACLDIIAHYRRGTEFNIAMDPLDKLITAGTSATQLTWMDAKRDGITFTPRHGKAIEINALWHAALKELAEAIRETDATIGANLNDLAGAVGRSIRGVFWNPRTSCLYDCLTPSDSGPGWNPTPDIRPNQLFAVSLPHSPLSIEQQRAVVAIVRERLLTPYGIRTLDPADPRYQGRYEGNLFERDRAYHNGTAWPWLLGPYAEAVLRIGNFSDAAKREARSALEPILAEMSSPPTRGGWHGPSGCLGQIAEIYDGDGPQRPQGCPAQAWSIAEVLRVMLML